MDYMEVIPNLFLGSCPENLQDVLFLNSTLKITAVLSLQTDGDIEATEIEWSTICREYVRQGIQLRRVQINDCDPTDLKDKMPLAVRTLNSLLESGKMTYVHCTAGVSRAPTIIAAYLCWCTNQDLAVAIKFLRTHRACFPERKTIEAARENFK